MTTLRERLDDYLVMRRSLGFQLNDIEREVSVSTFLCKESVSLFDFLGYRWGLRRSG